MIGAWDSHGKLVAKFMLPMPGGTVHSLLTMGYTLGPVKDDTPTWAEMSRGAREKLLLVPRERRRIQAVKELECQE